MPFTPIELAATIASAFLGREVTKVTPIVGLGAVNLIFIARTAEEQVVLRLSQPEDQHHALDFYQKEAWCIQQATALGIPGPTVLKVDAWDGQPYMLQTFIPGLNGASDSLDAQHIWHELGRYAHLIHSILLNGFGETLLDFQSGSAQQSWRAFVDYNLASLTDSDDLLRLKVYAPNQTAEIRDIFQTLRDTSFRFGLAHGDLSPRNTVVAETGQVSLLDWGSAEAHIVPHYDLIRWETPEGDNLNAFLGGYGLTESDFARLLSEIQALALLKSFDLVRWAIDRCPARIGSLAESARHLVHLQFELQGR